MRTITMFGDNDDMYLLYHLVKDWKNHLIDKGRNSEDAIDFDKLRKWMDVMSKVYRDHPKWMFVFKGDDVRIINKMISMDPDSFRTTYDRKNFHRLIKESLMKV